MSGSRFLMTSNDVETKGTIGGIRKRNRSQQSQISVDSDSDGRESVADGTNLNSLPSDIIEKILSHFTFRKMLDCRLISRRWNFAITDYTLHARVAFPHYLEKFQIEWVNLSTNCEEMIRNNNELDHEVIERCLPFRLPPRFNQNALYYSGFMYIFGGVVSNQTAFNDLWRFDLARKKWQRIIVNGDIPSPKIWTALHFYEFTDPNTGKARPSFVHMGHISLFSLTTFTATQERQLEQQEHSQIYVFDIETLTWRKLQQSGSLRVSLTGKFSSLITGDELLILCGAVTTGSNGPENGSPSTGNGKSVVYSFDLKQYIWSTQRTASTSLSRSQFDSMIPLNDHSILFHHQRRLFMFERNRCYSCQQCLDKKPEVDEEEAEEEIVWNVTNCDVITSRGEMRLFFNAKSAVYFQIDQHKFGAVLLRQIRLTIPPPALLPHPLKPPFSVSRSAPGHRDGERLAKLDRYMERMNHQHGRHTERMVEILDIEFFDSRQLLRDRILRPTSDPTSAKLFSCFTGVTFGSSYLPTVTCTPEGLLIFGGSQPYEASQGPQASQSPSGSSSASGIPPKSDFYMLIGRPNLNRLTSQMDFYYR